MVGLSVFLGFLWPSLPKHISYIFLVLLEYQGFKALFTSTLQFLEFVRERERERESFMVSSFMLTSLACLSPRSHADSATGGSSFRINCPTAWIKVIKLGH